MRIRLSQFLLVPVTSLFCMLAFSSTLPNAGENHSYGSAGESGVLFSSTVQTGNPSGFDVVTGNESVTQKPLLLAGDVCDASTACNATNPNKAYVCHVLVNGKYVDQTIDCDTAIKLCEEFSGQGEWYIGKCEEVMSPSTDS